MQDLLSDLDIKVVSAIDLHLDEVDEDGETIKENSLKKARSVNQQTGEWSVADDTGIFIDFLNGAPGINSARWTDRDNIVRHTLDKLKGVPEEKRGAHFKTVAVLVSPEGKEYCFIGRVNGHLSLAPKGKPRPSLPYDLLFIPERLTKTFAEMTDEEKNKISHRSISFSKLKNFLRPIVQKKKA